MTENTNSGLWTRPDVPKTGWYCDNVVDLGDQRELCEMCGAKWLRFQHHMHHDNHEMVKAGCICAGKMENDPDNAKARERTARRMAKRSDFEPKWQQSNAGNWWCKAPDDWRIIVFEDHKHGGYKYMFVKGDSEPTWGRKRADDLDEIKAAAANAFANRTVLELVHTLSSL